MDQDQFGGRTDDDLFADDIEPVSYEEEVVAIPPVTTTEPEPAETLQPPAPKVTPAPPVRAPPPKGLSDSRHNRPDRSRASNNNNNNNHKHRPSTEAPSVSAPSNISNATSPPPSAPKGPANSTTPKENNAAIIASESRANSGGRVPPKLSKAELDEKMEKGRLGAAKVEQRYRRAKHDEEQHAIAFAKGQEEALRRRQEEAARREEALKRKQEEAARRKAAMGERNRYDTDRVQNKGRKGMRAPWDEGKVDLDQVDTRTKATTGGVKGSVGSGLGASRYASTGQSHEPSRRESNPHGKHGRSNHGRKLFEPEDRHGHARNEHQPLPTSASPTTTTSQKPKAAEDFPALPSSGPAPTNTIASPTWVKPVGDWAEDVDAEGK